MLTALTGVTWGDEGKEQVVNFLAGQSRMVVRYQGSSHIGFSYRGTDGTFRFRILPAGILFPDTVSILADGTAIDPDQLRHEITMAEFFGLHVDPAHLKLSQRATLCMPCHIRRDDLLLRQHEISTAYSDKFRKNTIRMGDLLHLEDTSMQERLRDIIDHENLILSKLYGQEQIQEEEAILWLQDQAEFFRPYICNTGELIQTAISRGEQVLLEAQSGALRDIDYGVFPYTVSTNTIAAYAGIGAGIPGIVPDHIIGVLGAYSSCTGPGPFPAEKVSSTVWNNTIRLSSDPDYTHRTGPFDGVAARYGLQCQKADHVLLTGLDALSSFEKLPIITAYRIKNEITTDFPTGPELERAVPMVETVPGWHCPLDGCTTWGSLPEPAKQYIRRLERAIEHPIRTIALGIEPLRCITKPDQA